METKESIPIKSKSCKNNKETRDRYGFLTFKLNPKTKLREIAMLWFGGYHHRRELRIEKSEINLQAKDALCLLCGDEVK